MTINRELILPTPQNFIRIEGDVNSIPITDLTSEQMEQYAEECKQDLIRHYNEKLKQLK